MKFVIEATISSVDFSSTGPSWITEPKVKCNSELNTVIGFEHWNVFYQLVYFEFESDLWMISFWFLEFWFAHKCKISFNIVHFIKPYRDPERFKLDGKVLWNFMTVAQKVIIRRSIFLDVHLLNERQ